MRSGVLTATHGARKLARAWSMIANALDYDFSAAAERIIWNSEKEKQLGEASAVRHAEKAAFDRLAGFGVALYAYFFLAFLSMHRTLHNPFLERLIDVGHEPRHTVPLRKRLARLAAVDFARGGLPLAPPRRADRR